MTKENSTWRYGSPQLKVWSHLGLNQGLPDYESGALTN